MDPHRVPNRVGLDLVHNKDLHPADLDLEAPSSSKDQREVHRREHNLVHEGVHRRNLSREALVDPEDRGLNNPHKDLWVVPSHLLPQVALAGHLPEVRGGLETTKRNVHSLWVARCLKLLCAATNGKPSSHKTEGCKLSMS